MKEIYFRQMNENSVHKDFSLQMARQRRRCWLNKGFDRPFIHGLLCLIILVIPTEQCAVGLKTPGRTWPAGDIVLEHGSPLSILCILNSTFINTFFPGKNSSDLVFFKGPRQIENEFITILNDTTIRLDIDKPQPENQMYYCKLRLDETYNKDYEAVCLNKVVVGFKPSEPKSFDCVSQNWENMTCKWEPPENFVDTTYSITFKLPGRAGGRKLFPCPDIKDKPKNTCFWNAATNPIYRQPYEYYTFVLTGENVLGNWSNSYKFHHYANVIPARPTNLTVVNKTVDSAFLHWSVPFPMQTFPSGLHHRVAHQNQWESRDTWQIIDITNETHVGRIYYNLTGLKYANTFYDVRVYIRSAIAVGEDKWSNFSYVTFRTPATVPGQSPKTDVGSFEVFENNQNRDIYLYWQYIPAYLENGNDFRYQVLSVEENGRRVHLTPNETTRTYAKFRGLAHHSSYRFEIVASNEIGALEKPAKIFVPSRSSLPKEPNAFTKIAFDDGLYELSWKPPVAGAENVKNYTIFWCENDRDRPWQCQGYLEWVHVPGGVLVHNVTVPDPKRVYQFAISANTERASSGMMWASCTVIHNKVVGKMKTVWINRIGSDFIEVGWKLDCSDRIGIVEGFKIYYCPIVSPYSSNCKGPKLNTTIKADLNTIRGEVTGLKPYTTYMITVAVLTKNGEGQASDPLYNTTYEARPSDAPRNVVISNVTNSTMHVEWREPLAMNGVLRYYVVHYNGLYKKVEEVQHVDLTDLLAHTNYTVTVEACTVECSARSEPVYALTDIGVPEKLALPTVRFVNSSQVKVSWVKPNHPGGMLDYYQIRDNEGKIINTTNLEASLSIDCKTEGKEKLYRFQARAVNIGPNNEHLYGNWSDEGEGNCYSDGPSYRVWVIIWIIGSICGIAFVFCIAYSSKRAWLKCKAMQDVEVKLPPGLAPNMKLLSTNNDQHTRQSSSDSSGCSSAQESVTSALTSESNVSSDSGADVDPVVSTSNLIKNSMGPTSNGSNWESSNLRQRNVAGMNNLKPCGNEALISQRWGDSYITLNKGSKDENLSSTADDKALSLAKSTPDLTDLNNISGYVQNVAHNDWSSTGYLSTTPSSEVSDDSSTVPKDSTGNLMTPGSYSMVGVMPLVKGKANCNSSKASTIKPYVSFTQLENNTQAKWDSSVKLPENGKLAMDSLRCDLNFDELIPAAQVQQQQSLPYVQTGLLESKLSPFELGRVLSPATHRPQHQQQLLAEDLTNKLEPSNKSYVSVGSMNESKFLPITSTNENKSYVSVSSVMPDPVKMQMHAFTKHNVQTDEVFTEEPENVGLYPTLDLDKMKSESTSTLASSFSMEWQTDMQEADISTSTTCKPSPGYVSMPNKRTPADESYSKVAVVPRH